MQALLITNLFVYCLIIQGAILQTILLKNYKHKNYFIQLLVLKDDQSGQLLSDLCPFDLAGFLPSNMIQTDPGIKGIFNKNLCCKIFSWHRRLLCLKFFNKIVCKIVPWIMRQYTKKVRSEKSLHWTESWVECMISVLFVFLAGGSTETLVLVGLVILSRWFSSHLISR